MKKTVLSIAQSFYKRINLTAPASLYGSTDPDAIQLLQLIYDVAEELRQAKVFIQQKRTYSFDTVADTTKYQLPTDFYSPILSTHWNQDETDRLIGPVSDNQFNWHLYSGHSSLTNYTYRIFGWDNNPNSELGQFEVNPTPASAQTLSFDYLTRHLFLPPNWLPATVYTTANYVNVNGNIYKCTSNGTSSADDPPSGTDASGIADGTAEWGYYNTPYEAILTDNDLCLFDYDLMKIGLRAKWYEEHGGELAESAAIEFKSKIDRAVTRYKGSRKGSFASDVTGPRYHMQYKSWSFS